jgi:hypothetical protein
MIVASRIPALTERMKAATLRAAREQQGAVGVKEIARTPREDFGSSVAGLFFSGLPATRDFIIDRMLRDGVGPGEYPAVGRAA